jgi:transketolase
MTVMAVCDADEMTRFMNTSLDWPGPIYIRLAKGGDPIVSRAEHGFAIGRAIVMRAARGPDPVVLMATGVMTTNCISAAAALAEQGIECSVVHFHTIKPLDEPAVVEHGRRARLVVTVEEGVKIGGFGSAVTDVLVAQLDGSLPGIIRLGIADAFADKYGSQGDLLELYGLLPQQIAASVESALGRKGCAA